ncbi:CdaR family transcriptional regulator [Allobacillus sp. GCM10007491]|uniref:Helix-turn-helix domain-containing protein n=1 Tax=Allobacillus saliphilus TaxID=2912308 RepID=A0A941CUD8_9BACI|nr:helix-turn-helix domain-containing protein [Allobacillus saliphilus]
MNEFVQFAQKAVKAVSNILPFPISLTDDKGLIVGDSNSRRIGTFHAPSQQVIIENKLVLFDEATTDHTKNIYPGAAVPLHFDFETIGVLGIIGDPKEVEPYALLVKSYIEMMWHEAAHQQRRTFEISHMETFLHYVLFTPDAEKEKIIDYCDMMDIPHSKTRFIIVADFGHSLSTINQKTLTLDEIKYRFIHLMKNIFNNHDDLCAFLNNDRIVMCKPSYGIEDYKEQLKEFDTQAKRFSEQANRLSIKEVSIAAGPLVSSIDELTNSYQKADLLIRFAKKNGLNGGAYHCLDPYILANLFYDGSTHLLDEPLEMLLQPLLQDPASAELIKNFTTYLECNMNISEAAEQLFVHRNTLLYRLNKVERMTGIPYKNFKLASMLYYYLQRKASN